MPAERSSRVVRLRFGWLRVSHQVRESHRADSHQVLAYATLFDAPKITTTLVDPLRPVTFAALRSRARDVARAELFHGGRQLTLELQGLPFGGIAPPEGAVASYGAD